MKRNKRLKQYSNFLRLIMILQVLICLVLVFVYFHSLINPESYVSLIITDGKDLVYNFNAKEIPRTYEEWKLSDKLVHYNLLDGFSKFYVIWTKVINFIGFFFILYFLDKFLNNTNNFKLFFNSNIKIINKIVFIIVGLFVFNTFLNSFTFGPISMVFQDEISSHYVTKAKASLDFFIYYPLAITFFVILKEVFKRGQELKQENDLTI